MNDRDITQQVRRLLATLIEDLDSIRVEVESGIAYLEGIAATPALRRGVELAVSRVPGVKKVVNCLATEHVAHLSYSPAIPALAGYRLYQLTVPRHSQD